jgi:hypothetical protein
VTWKPSTVEDIRAWFAGTYVPNPTREEYTRQLTERLRQLSREARRPQ